MTAGAPLLPAVTPPCPPRRRSSQATPPPWTRLQCSTPAIDQDAFGTGLPTRRQGAAWITRPFAATTRVQRSAVMADSCSTIYPVTQVPHPGRPRSPGTLSVISLEWVSAISGMRTQKTESGRPPGNGPQREAHQNLGPFSFGSCGPAIGQFQTIALVGWRSAIDWMRIYKHRNCLPETGHGTVRINSSARIWRTSHHLQRANHRCGTMAVSVIRSLRCRRSNGIHPRHFR